MGSTPTCRQTDGKVELHSCMSQLKTRKLNAGPADTGHARQKMGRVYAAPKPMDKSKSMHRPFKKTRMYETSQSCDRVHLGHLKILR